MDVQGKTVLTNFWGMNFTTDKLRSLVKYVLKQFNIFVFFLKGKYLQYIFCRKWQTLIEAHVDVKTTDGYYLRVFALGFTKRRPNQQKKTCYAQTSQIRQIRAKMIEIINREATTCELKDLVVKL